MKQGSVLASKMAALHTDGVNRLFEKSGLGVTYGNTRVNNLIFQDDIVKIENSKERVNEANHIYDWFSKINGMMFHEIKSEWISLTRFRESFNFTP